MRSKGVNQLKILLDLCYSVVSHDPASYCHNLLICLWAENTLVSPPSGLRSQIKENNRRTGIQNKLRRTDE